MTDFRRLHSKENRIEESRKIREKYPERIPVIVEKSKSCQELPDIDKHKFLVPKDLTMGQFIYVIRKRIKLTLITYLVYKNIIFESDCIINKLN